VTAGGAVGVSITEIPLDMFSRNALGHAFSVRHDADLAIGVLRQAAACMAEFATTASNVVGCGS
jgi:hypothetical protein